MPSLTKTLRTVALVGCAMLLSGCFHMRARHVLRYYGDSDTGWYQLRFPDGLVEENKLQEMLAKFRKFSRPTARTTGGRTIIEDLSGAASMEYMYDQYKCTDSPQPDFVDCRFVLEVTEEVGRMDGWSLAWEVELQPRMRVLTSNHAAVRREGNRDILVWSFDGNKVSQATVAFVVRVPRA
ncbi:hypothetical protein [Gemmatimonas sp.]|jgi:hypothetical protein|uniref:hypothetical protein n=1 Tax=Gemmatimonas sp. TaxID=1962908 RepID=UPI0037C0D22C